MHLLSVSQSLGLHQALTSPSTTEFPFAAESLCPRTGYADALYMQAE